MSWTGSLHQLLVYLHVLTGCGAAPNAIEVIGVESFRMAHTSNDASTYM